ncbi:MAG: hypothetical protein KF799_06995 [Bdellovibrionales bacterium]|nr:hypothetical protein [Bdellovibrionales bacterium]
MSKFIILVFLFTTGVSYADSPLTSTNFWREHLDVEKDTRARVLIMYAYDSAVLTDQMMDFLSSTKFRLGSKLALVNALYHQGLYHQPSVSPNAELYLRYLENKYQITIVPQPPFSKERSLTWDLVYGSPRFEYPIELTTDELTVLGYLIALNKYDMPTDALGFLMGGVHKRPKSLAARTALALALGNMVMLGDEELAPLAHHARWGYVYALFVPLLEQSKLFADLPRAPFNKIMEYISNYKGDYDEWLQEQVGCEAKLKPNIWTRP